MMKQRILYLLAIFLLPVSVLAQPAFTFEHFNVTTTPVLGGNNFKSVAVTPTGAVWASSQYHGLSKYDPVTSSWTRSTDITDVLITDMKPIGNSGIWLSQAGRSGTQGGGSNIAGGVNYFGGPVSGTSFYSITAPGGLTSRNARSVWVDENHRGSDNNSRVWVAQGTYISSNATTAGGISVGVNSTPNHFTKIYKGLQVTPNVPAAQAGLPNCIAVGGNNTEVWICALANFGRSQILRYRADDPGTFIGYYDYTNTPTLTIGFRANSIFFDRQGRGWIGLNEGGLIIKTSEGWLTMKNIAVLPAGTAFNANAVTQDERGNIYFGTSNGLLEYNGGAITDVASYRMITTTQGLLQNNITGVAADTVNKRLILSHSNGISFMKFNKKIDYSLEWDYSFPKESTKPVGVAADGTSRLYMKIRRGSNVSMGIKKIVVSVKNIASQNVSLCGKLKKAIETSQYSNEANTGTGTEAERTDSTANGDFYFWYVAPDDFSVDSLSNFAQLTERNDTVKIKVTYADNSQDSTDMPIKLVRPPVIVTGMLANSAEIFRNLKTPEGTPLLNSTKYPSRLMMLNALKTYNENVTKMMEEDDDRDNTGSSSIPQTIKMVRKKRGIAATRVDMVAHGVAGRIVRKMIQLKPQKYYADGDQTYNNYGKGYVNKFVGVNVPHNGSPLFQMMNDYEKTENRVNRKKMALLLKTEPNVTPYPVVREEQGALIFAAPLFKKALADAEGDDDLPETPVKNHQIGTELGETPPAGINRRFAMLRNLMRYQVLNMRDMNLQLRPQIDSILQTPGNIDDKVNDVMGIYSASKGQTNFTKVGDLISSIGSQLAGSAQNLAHVTKKMASSLEENDHESTMGYSSKIITNLLNTSIHSNSFANSIPAKIAGQVGSVATKIGTMIYDTSKIVITNREELGASEFRTQNTTESNDTTILLKYTVKDTARLQYVCISFQDTMYLSFLKTRNQQVPLKIKKTIALSGVQELSAVAVYESTDSIKYHADTLNTFVRKSEAVQGFRITEEEVELVEGITYVPKYEIKVNEEWEFLPADDAEINFTIENTAKAVYNNTNNNFMALEDGFTRVYFQYKTYRDTVAFNCMLALSDVAVNRTIANGSFKNAASWSKGRAPFPSDSVIISTGHSIVLDTTVRIRSLKIETGALLTLSNNALQLQLGNTEDGSSMIDNYGALAISNGTLKVSGQVKHNAGASFNMSGGLLIIDGNTGYTVNSLQNGMYLFEAFTGMASFNFTGGTLQLIDPPIGLASQAISCPYNFGANSTLILGNGISTTAANNPNGFGGNGFPPQIGRLILDASAGSNRLLRITKPLTVKGSFEVRTGSNLQLQAPVTVSP